MLHGSFLYQLNVPGFGTPLDIFEKSYRAWAGKGSAAPVESRRVFQRVLTVI